MNDLAALGINLPKDLTPAQRARLKAYWHIGVIALTHALLAIIVLINQNQVVQWQTLIYTFSGQLILALIDSGKKYVTAQGDLPLATLLSLGRNEIAPYIPAVTLDANKAAIEQQVSNLLQPTPDTTQTFNTPLATSPTFAGPATVQPAIDAAYHPPIDAGMTINTLPNIGVVKPQ